MDQENIVETIEKQIPAGASKQYIEIMSSKISHFAGMKDKKKDISRFLHQVSSRMTNSEKYSIDLKQEN